MRIDDKSSLAELVFQREFFQEDSRKILKIFKDNLPPCCKTGIDVLVSRVEILFENTSSIEEQMEHMQKLLFKYPKFLKATIYRIEKKGQLRQILENLCSKSRRNLLESILRNTDLETLELFLTVDGFYVLLRILLRNDLALIKKIPPFIFFKVLLEASVKDKDFLLSCLTEERLLTWKNFYQPKVIEDTLLIFTEILQIHGSQAQGILKVFSTLKEKFSIAYLEGFFDYTPTEQAQIERYFVQPIHPELFSVLDLIRERVPFEQFASHLEELSIPIIATILKTKTFLNFLQTRSVSFGKILFSKLSKDSHFLETLHSPTPYGSTLLLHLLLSHSRSMRNILNKSEDISSFVLKNFEFVLGEQKTLACLTENCELHLLENPYVMTYLHKFWKNVPAGSSVLAEGIEQQTFCLEDETLEAMHPEKIREFFLILLPKAKVITEEITQFKTTTQTIFRTSFSEFFTNYFVDTYFRVKQTMNPSDSVKEFLSCIPLKFFLASFARPFLRNYLLDLFFYLDHKVQKMLLPLFKDHEIYDLLRNAELHEVDLALDLLHPDQFEIIEELAPNLMKFFEITGFTRNLNGYEEKERMLKKIRSFMKAPGIVQKMTENLQKINSLKEEMYSSLEECPITKDIPLNPVIIRTSEGYEKQIYEKAALFEWVQAHHTSPSTRRAVSLEDIETYDFTKKAQYEMKDNLEKPPEYLTSINQILTLFFLDLLN